MYRVILVVDLNIPTAFAPKRVAIGKGDLILKNTNAAVNGRGDLAVIGSTSTAASVGQNRFCRRVGRWNTL